MMQRESDGDEVAGIDRLTRDRERLGDLVVLTEQHAEGRLHMAGEGDARSSAELAVKHVSWSKLCAVAALANPAPASPDWRPVAFSGW